MKESEPSSYPNAYLLVINVPVFVGEDGSRQVAELWHHDLARHTTYLPDFRMAAPARKSPSSEPLRTIENLPLEVIELPPLDSARALLLQAPALFTKLWSSVKSAHTVHTGIAGWPVPLGWLAAPIALVQGKRLILVVESAPWRTHDGSLKERARALIYENLARFWLRRADLAFFTQSRYREEFLPEGDPRGHVIPASWIDDARVLSNERARTLWQEKLGAPRARFVFAGRLTSAKGVAVLLEAARLLDRRQVGVDIEILGQGDLLSDCQRTAAELSVTRLNLLGTRPYDDSFFEALAGYHALLVPSLGDEQPRIVYDAYSQALPVLASDTDGLRDCVKSGRTGLLVPPGDAVALADAIERFSASLPELEKFGLESLEFARGMTHQRMHALRAKILSASA